MKYKLSLLLITLALFACGGEDTESSKTSVQTIRVTVTTPIIEDLRREQTAVGSIEALQAPILAAEVAEHVKAVHVKVGSVVLQGDLLAELEDEALQIAVNEAQARLQEITALIENQQRTVNRMRELVKKHAQSQEVLDTAEADLQAKQAQLAAAGAGLALTKNNLAKSKIPSPIDGIIQEVDIVVGDYVGVGTPLFQIVNPNLLQAQLDFPETVRGFLSKGQIVFLRTPSDPDTIVESEVTDIAPMLISQTRAVEVLVDFENPGQWQAGSSVDGTVLVELIPNSIFVPEVSVVRRPIGEVVFVLESDSRVSERVVLAGMRRDGLVHIIEGLTGNEVIVVDGAGFLVDQTNVEIVER